MFPVLIMRYFTLVKTLFNIVSAHCLLAYPIGLHKRGPTVSASDPLLFPRQVCVRGRNAGVLEQESGCPRVASMVFRQATRPFASRQHGIYVRQTGRLRCVNAPFGVSKRQGQAQEGGALPAGKTRPFVSKAPHHAPSAAVRQGVSRRSGYLKEANRRASPPPFQPATAAAGQWSCGCCQAQARRRPCAGATLRGGNRCSRAAQRSSVSRRSRPVRPWP